MIANVERLIELTKFVEERVRLDGREGFDYTDWDDLLESDNPPFTMKELEWMAKNWYISPNQKVRHKVKPIITPELPKIIDEKSVTVIRTDKGYDIKITGFDPVEMLGIAGLLKVSAIQSLPKLMRDEEEEGGDNGNG